jgi:protein-S-isoprenylcysteine O-methyltransferase Ste14
VTIEKINPSIAREAIKMKWAGNSKTIIFNVVTLIVTVAVALQAVDFIPSDVAKWFGVVITIGNIVLRFLTTEPISLSKSE